MEPWILILFFSSIFGVAGNSSFCFPIKSYEPEFVRISILFFISATIVILVSDNSFVISYNCFNQGSWKTPLDIKQRKSLGQICLYKLILFELYPHLNCDNISLFILGSHTL